MKKPSISKLLQLLDKPALLQWANKKGLEGIDISRERQRVMSAGTSIHNQIQSYIEHKSPFIDKKTQLGFESFIADKEILGCEIDLETDYFIGRYDLKVKHNDSIILVDFKSSSKGASKKIYLENKLQLVAYGMAEKCNSFAIVTLPDFSMIPVEIKDRTPYEQIIISLSNIYSQKQIIENEANGIKL